MCALRVVALQEQLGRAEECKPHRGPACVLSICPTPQRGHVAAEEPWRLGARCVGSPGIAHQLGSIEWRSCGMLMGVKECRGASACTGSAENAGLQGNGCMFVLSDDAQQPGASEPGAQGMQGA